MKRCGHRQWQGAFGALGLEQRTGLVHRRLAACNHRLRRVVEVDGFNDFKAICGVFGHSPRHFCANSYHFCSIQAQNRCHCARADGHGFLHGGSAQAHQWRSLCQRQHARGHQRRIRAQRVPGHCRRQRAAFSTPDAPRSYASHQHHRLGVGGQRQLFFGAVLNQARHVFAQRVRGFLQRLHHGGVLAPAIQHAHGLGALTGKDKSKRFHANY